MVFPIKSSARPLAQDIRRQIPPQAWRFLIVTVLVIGIFFRFANLENKPYWWNKFLNFPNIPIAEIINSSEKPLVLTPEAVSSHLISISHNLNDRVTIRFVDQPNIAQEAEVFSDRFLLNYPQPWLDSIAKESQFKLEKVYQGTALEDHAAEFNFSLMRIL